MGDWTLWYLPRAARATPVARNLPVVVIGRRSLVLVSERRIVAPDGARVVRVGGSDAGRGGRVASDL